MQNPAEFKKGEFVRSGYSGKIYEIKEPNKNGMAKLLSEYGYLEDWNAFNNPHFLKVEPQLKLNF